MAIIYVYSGAVGADDGTSWTDAYTSITTGTDAWTVGDEVWVADDHTQAGTNTINVQAANSDRDNSIIVYRMNRATNTYSPTTGTDIKQYDRTDPGADIDFGAGGDNFYGTIAGVFFSTDDNIDPTFDNTHVTFIDCYFLATSSGAKFFAGIRNEGTNFSFIRNCTIEFTHADGGSVRQQGSTQHLEGVTFKGIAASSGLFNVDANDEMQSWLTGCDFTGMTIPILVDVDSGDPETASVWHFIACSFKVGQVIHDGGFGSDGSFIYIHNSDGAGNTYVSERYGLRGSVRPDLVTYYNGTDLYQDLDNNTRLSHKMEVAANTSLGDGLASLDLYGRITVPGSKTFTIEILENFTTALTKRDCWIDVWCLSKTDSTLWVKADDREFAALTYTALLTGSGLGNWISPTTGARSAKLVVTANVVKAGVYKLVLFVNRYEAGKQVNYNPAITIT